MKQIVIYSDGSSLGNPGAGGWGTILEYKGHIKELSGGEDNTTNNRMELKGVIEGLRAIKEPCEVKIISDSSYVVNGINSWLKGWIAKGWVNSSKQPVKNQDLWEDYVTVSTPHNIEAIWVKGHNGHPQNERCDKLAKYEATKIKNSKGT
jgi:ribonuclease HI